MRAASGRAGVGCATALSAWFDPDLGIKKLVISGGRRADTEAGTNNIAPVTPLVLLGRLNTVAGYKISLALFSS